MTSHQRQLLAGHGLDADDLLVVAAFEAASEIWDNVRDTSGVDLHDYHSIDAYLSDWTAIIVHRVPAFMRQ